ncbi:hypothetical protein ALC56_05938 [Trachymyrmex septentrionalis]|uniref:Uncharacterized protein n=1 Tax=Trachymyrmex septentrionalis TaxID=34720 RepID=A0A195FFH0_9HYME|nr:hypothetical protein ALC56_05938 [Trachymyrmex septentrionalis]
MRPCWWFFSWETVKRFVSLAMTLTVGKVKSIGSRISPIRETFHQQYMRNLQGIYRLPILRFTTLLDSVKPSNLANI